MTSRRRWLFVLAMVVSLAAGACGGDGNDGGNKPINADDGKSTVDQGKELKTVKAGRLTACSDVRHAPFAFEENGEIKGIDIDLVRAIGGRLGLTADFRKVDAAATFDHLAKGDCDIIASSVSITEKRKESNDFSQGYFEIRQSLLVRKADEAKYKDLDSLKGRTIGVQSETTGAAYAKANAKDSQIREFTGVDELFTALKAGQVDAILQDQPVNAYHAKTTGESVVTKVFEEGEPEQYGLVIPKGKDALKKAIDDALTQIKSDDSYRTILTQYLGSTAGQA